MHSNLPIIDPEDEKKLIVSFLKKIFTKQKISKAVIGVSGGINSAVSFSLLSEALKPENIIIAHLYYFESKFGEMEKFVKKRIPQQNVHHISIKEAVDTVKKLQHIENTETNNVRIGNIAARIRMIILYDYAKKYNALVCG